MRFESGQQRVMRLGWERPGSPVERPVLTNRMSESFTYGSVGGAGGNPGPYPATNSRPASPFEGRGLRRCALVLGSHGRYHGGAAVAQFTVSRAFVRQLNSSEQSDRPRP